MKQSRPRAVRTAKTGRPQAFDLPTVLEGAMVLFWTQGYEATSMQELVEATGINRGSIYNTFGDKEGLFIAVLDHYAATVVESLIEHGDEESFFVTEGV